MHRLPLYMRALVGLATGLVAAGAWAQPATQPQDPQQHAQSFMSLWNPQVMIDRSVKQAVDRYKLTPEQEQVARKMTMDGVNAFLDKHEEEIRTLVRDAIAARISGNAPTSAQAQDWAKRAAPLFEEGKQEILKGNQQFRGVLTDEQKKLFDVDQQLLQQQLSSSKERLERWTDGRFNPETDWFGPQRKPAATRPSGQPELDRWDLFVRGFVSRYKLDGAQVSQAMGILVDSKKRATEYWYSRKVEIETANARIRQMLSDPSLREEVPAARKQLEDLNKPIETLYAEMQERLGQIPTETQRKAYDAEVQARHDRWRDRLQRPSTNVAISATSQSQPAASQMARGSDSAPASQAADSQLAAVDGPASQPVRIQGPGTRPGSTSSPASQPTRRSHRNVLPY